jgi:hypothetical protein
MLWFCACSFDTAPSFGRHLLAADDGGSALAGHRPSSASGAAPAAAPDAGTASDLPDAANRALDRSALDASPAQPLDARVLDASGHDAAKPNPPATSAASEADAGTASDAAATKSHACREGSYSANLTCMVDPTGVTPMTATAQVTIALQQTSAGTLAASGPNISFNFPGYVLAGDVTGALDCATGAFHATIVNGLFTAVLLPVLAQYSGTIDGQVDDVTNTLSGTWSFSASGGTACTGPWSATLQP